MLRPPGQTHRLARLGDRSTSGVAVKSREFPAVRGLEEILVANTRESRALQGSRDGVPGGCDGRTGTVDMDLLRTDTRAQALTRARVRIGRDPDSFAGGQHDQAVAALCSTVCPFEQVGGPQELRDEPGGGMLVDLLRRPQLLDPAAVHDR